MFFPDGSSGWLADAQAEYAVSFLSRPNRPLPASAAIYRGCNYVQQGVELSVTT